MTCTEIKDMLSAFIDEELDSTEMLQVKEHLENCIECRQEEQDLRSLLKEIASLEDAPIPYEFDKRLGEALAAEGKKIREEKIIAIKAARRSRIKRISSVAAVFMVGLFSVILYNNSSEEFPLDAIESTLYKAEKSSQSDDMNSPADGVTAGGADSEKNSETQPPTNCSDSSDSTSAEDAANNSEIADDKQTANNHSIENKDKIVNQQNADDAGNSEASMLRSNADQAEGEAVEPYTFESTPAEYDNAAAQPLGEDEESIYLEKLAALLSESNYQIISCQKNEDGVWHMEVLISMTNDKGEKTEESAVYCGWDGKVWKKEL